MSYDVQDNLRTKDCVIQIVSDAEIEKGCHKLLEEGIPHSFVFLLLEAVASV